MIKSENEFKNMQQLIELHKVGQRRLSRSSLCIVRLPAACAVSITSIRSLLAPSAIAASLSYWAGLKSIKAAVKYSPAGVDFTDSPEPYLSNAPLPPGEDGGPADSLILLDDRMSGEPGTAVALNETTPNSS